MNGSIKNRRTEPNVRPAPHRSWSRKEASRIEQRALRRSVYGVVLVAVGSVAYGVYLESNVVVLNGIFSVLSLVAGGLRLLAAKLVVRPEDQRFPYGYSHVEPLVHTVNAFLVLVICVYSFINGLDGIRSGGNEVDATGVIWFAVVSAGVCLGFWAYEAVLARKIDSQLLRNDAKEWLMDFAFSMVTLVGFVVLPFLSEPYRALWGRYADPAMVAVMALVLVPIPLGILNRSIREVLLMADTDDALIRRVEGGDARGEGRARHRRVRPSRRENGANVLRGDRHRRGAELRAADRRRAGRSAPAHLDGAGDAARPGMALDRSHHGSALGLALS